jgi:predicted AAA+ superfamily ATPase
MHRDSDLAIDAWYKTPTGERKPLVLRGARQVGKSTLVRNFAKKNGLTLFEINLETTELVSVGNSLKNLDLGKIISEIETKCKLEFTAVKSIIFFDEIQSQENVFGALRYFFELKPDIAIIAAGSLFEFYFEKNKTTMPVGRVQFHHMGPMKFSEFLKATGDEILEKKLENSFSVSSKFRDFCQTHSADTFERLREYFFVGGMPAAVKSWASYKSPLKVTEIHASIIETYRNDFQKYSGRIENQALARIFSKIPGVLGKKLKYSALAPDEKSKTVSKVVDLFCKAKILSRVTHSNASGMPLVAGADDSVFKLFFLDVGLLNFMMGLRAESLLFSRTSEEKLLSEGLSAEQFVAQHLIQIQENFSNPEIFYWLKDKDSQKAEVDFITNFFGSILPVEVKSGKSGTLRSLGVFTKTHSNVECFVQLSKISEPESKPFGEGKTLYRWPLFAVERLGNPRALDR